MRALELIQELKKLIETHGDLPVMVFIEDDGSYDIQPPKFDTDA